MGSRTFFEFEVGFSINMSDKFKLKYKYRREIVREEMDALIYIAFSLLLVILQVHGAPNRSAARDKLVFTHIIFRHGDRNIIEPYPTVNIFFLLNSFVPFYFTTRKITA